jgi:hypothetical protein
VQHVPHTSVFFAHVALVTRGVGVLVGVEVVTLGVGVFVGVEEAIFVGVGVAIVVVFLQQTWVEIVKHDEQALLVVLATAIPPAPSQAVIV